MTVRGFSLKKKRVRHVITVFQWIRIYDEKKEGAQMRVLSTWSRSRRKEFASGDPERFTFDTRDSFLMSKKVTS